ncbi:hypothetical protein [Geobacter sp. DSM 9736]|uniref:hypothetical protein n=1 Tax=Geobacter sp. DSM 9736 TaxID=1277350 RepID=UPI000B50CB4E|nr:hypothetical protein [Geobacter sp. DSM 9736]SNB47603.1 hypothetical protein SAMN06269301_3094 [Geobacter sp. DSM 9736]
MKKIIGWGGVILLLLSQQTVLIDQGVSGAIFFLGLSMCLCVLCMATLPIIMQIVTENSRDHYIRLYEQYIEKRQEAIKRLEEELLQKRRK